MRNGPHSPPERSQYAPTPLVDGTSLGASGLSFLVAYEDSLTSLPTAYGELLFDPTSAFLAFETEILSGSVATYDPAIPNDRALAGGTATTQVFLNGSLTLTNALDLVFGL